MDSVRMRRSATVVLVLYAIQFGLGMTVNLFVTLPTSHPGRTGDEYFSRSWASLLWALSLQGGVPLFIHALTGAVLFAASLGLLVTALATRVRGWRWATGLAAFFTFGAFFNGMSYLDYGEEFSSAIMAGCWLGAVISLVVPFMRRRAAASAVESA